ncbi:hypothetical protein H8E65_05515, partial [Candidatus Bathyarchaeota archaeon]|nr:hypothetical protein [Candidatus Bathyarchaeota archaeon]
DKPVGFYREGGKTKPITRAKAKKTRVVKRVAAGAKSASEVEFLCANSEYPGFGEILRKHKVLFEDFSQRKGLIPYRQDFSDLGPRQFSFAVIVQDPAQMSYVERRAKEVELPIDLVQVRPGHFVDSILEGRLEGLISHILLVDSFEQAENTHKEGHAEEGQEG